MRITDEERFVIDLLAHPTFNVDFIEKFQAGVSNNCKPAVLQAELNGFMAAVRAFVKPGVKHTIYREIDVENKLEDIKRRMRKYFSGKSKNHKVILRLYDDNDFLQSVYNRWEKSLGWTDISDVYWETCDDAIKEVLQQRHILLD